MSSNPMSGTEDLPVGRFVLADPTGQIERECADKAFTQKSVALTYALAIRDECIVPVDWRRANEAIRKRWPAGLERVKKMAWGMKVPSPSGSDTP